MKKLFSVLILIILLLSLTACEGMSVSNKKYEEIKHYVLDHADAFSPEQDIEFFDYDSTGLCVGGTYYGYYYTARNLIEVPDYYTGDELGEAYIADGGTYFGKPNNGTDWCYIKRITENWYYYELHWG